MQIKISEDINSPVVNAIRSGANNVDGADTIEYAILNKERGGSMRRVEKF